MAVVALAVLTLSTVAGCKVAGTTACSSTRAISNPVEAVDSLSFAAVIGTVGDRSGTTKVYDPGYKAHLYRFDVEQVLVNKTSSAVDAVGEVANVHYPKPPQGCGAQIPVASLQPGQRMMLLLGPPDPSKAVWTVDGDVRALDLPENSGGYATWQAQVPGCAEHLKYDVSQLTAALSDPTARSVLVGRCLV